MKCGITIKYALNFSDFKLEVDDAGLLVDSECKIIKEKIEFYIEIIQTIGCLIKKLILLYKIIE